MKNFLKNGVTAVLTFEAQMLLKRRKPKIVGITGSVGKTSTKDAIYTVLKDHLHARKSEKSFNSDIGVALTVLGLRNAWNNPLLWLKNIVDGALHAFFTRDYPEVLVLEMGVDRPGDMERLTKWITPDIAVLTRFPDVPVHVEYFSSPEQVAEEKMALARGLAPDGICVYNHDDEIIVRHLEEIRQQCIGFSRYSPSQFTASGDTVIYDGSAPAGVEFVLTHVNEEEERFVVMGSLGQQHLYSYAAAAAVGSLFDISLKDAAAALTDHQPPQGRMRLIEGLSGSVIIDDTYNSSPTACEHAIQALHELRIGGRKIAVLGDMLELGQYSVREHERIGEFLAGKVDVLVTVGVRAQKIAERALEFGMSEKAVFSYDEAPQAAEQLEEMAGKGDVILVKASQGIRAEKIVKALMKDPSKAAALLVRQDEAWERK
jgi:UDP-N-acetylmuramoyl-tripeptide--D-alanyl-D-alanine ligase